MEKVLTRKSFPQIQLSKMEIKITLGDTTFDIFHDDMTHTDTDIMVAINMKNDLIKSLNAIINVKF